MIIKCIFLLITLVCSAGYSESDFQSILEEQYRASGAEEIQEAIPDYAMDFLEKIGLDGSVDPDAELTAESAAELIAETARSSWKQPVAVMTSVLAVTVLCALAGQLAGDREALGSSFNTVASAACAMAVCLPVGAYIDRLSGGISDVCRLGAVLIPVLGGLAAAGGSTAAAAAGSSLTLGVLELITVLIPGVLIPTLRILLGISMVSSFCGVMDIGRLAVAVDKALRWMLGLAGVLLSGILGVSTLAASAADGASVRAARFVLSGAVPVVGGVISEAIGTIANCVGIIKGSVGAFGIAAVLFIVLPAVVLAVIWLCGLRMLSWAAEGMGVSGVGSTLNAMASVVSLSLGLTAFAALTVTCSAAMIMNLGSV